LSSRWLRLSEVSAPNPLPLRSSGLGAETHRATTSRVSPFCQDFYDFYDFSINHVTEDFWFLGVGSFDGRLPLYIAFPLDIYRVLYMIYAISHPPDLVYF